MFLVLNMKYLKIHLLIISLLFFFSCNKEITVDPPEEPVHTGIIFIASNPTHAKIFLENRNTGKFTPDSIRWLKEGIYKIFLRLEGWKDSAFIVNVKEQQRQNFNIDFSYNPAMFGAIECKTHPVGGQIFLDGKDLRKTTPYTIYNLLPGYYNLGFHKDRYWFDTLTVKVESQKITSIYRVLADTAVWVAYNKSNSSIPSNFILNAAIDNENIIWIGTDDNGFASFNGKEWTNYNKSNSPLPDNRINALYLDKNNNKWIGTTNYGLVKFDGINWTIYNSANSGLPGDMITAITSDENNNLWIGTYNKGVAVLRGNDWEVFNTTNSGLPSNFISAIIFDRDGTLWIGTDRSGIVKYDGNNWTVYNSANADLPPSNICSSLAIDNNGILYAGFLYDLGSQIPGGLSKYEAGSWTLIQSNYIDISTLTIDKYNYIWAGSAINGFGLINGRFVFRDVFNKHNSPITSNMVNTIAVDKEMYKWIGTGGNGLIKYKNYR